MAGSGDLLQTLFARDLVDRMNLWVYPVVLGTGKRLFADGATPAAHRLVESQAFPGGEPQERAVGFVYFLNKYGPALVDRLYAELPTDAGTHWVVTI